MPLAYNNSSIALSLFASGVDSLLAWSIKLRAWLTEIGLGNDLPTLGELTPSVGLVFIIPSATKKSKKDFTAATLRATVVGT